MSAPGWLTGWLADVPAGDGWLSARERAVLAGLRVEKRRADWLLGRWTAKLVAAAWLGTEPSRLEIIAAADGAPEAWIDGERAPISVSLSHRGGRALAAVADRGALGCDLELVEPRSAAFVRPWLSPSEQALVAEAAVGERAHAANLLWTAKEAAAKALRGGLRLDLQRTVVDLDSADPPERGWWSMRVACDDKTLAGWWRSEPGWTMAVVVEPASDAPRALDG
jgi:4'-phosphopantetheinyl transferase